MKQQQQHQVDTRGRTAHVILDILCPDDTKRKNDELPIYFPGSFVLNISRNFQNFIYQQMKLKGIT